MAPTKLLDSHIHLWPNNSLSLHGWMVPGHILSKRHGIADYDQVTKSTSSVQPSGFVYVETDRYLPSPTPDIPAQEPNGEKIEKLKKWAHAPLEELKFLRRIVEGTPEDGDGFASGDGEKMAGCVIWAPFNLPCELFDLYLQIAEEVSGPRLWGRVVGFRYLLQGVKEEDEVRKKVGEKHWLQNMLKMREARAGKGWAFEVGVDTHRDGVKQIQVIADMVKKVRELEGDGADGRVRFILNHLCKPDLNRWTSFQDWAAAITLLGQDEAVYMKLSGCFNEFDPSPTPSDISDLVQALQPYLDYVFSSFGKRVMFGSDWPVCNVGGPKAELSWGVWYQVVEKVLEGKANDVDAADVWWRAGCKAYGIESLGGEGV